jgi:hypothetical protein
MGNVQHSIHIANQLLSQSFRASQLNTTAHLPIFSARNDARFLVSCDEFSLPM